MAFRSSTGDLHLQEEYRRPAERWDREKFDRLGARDDRDRESVHIRESDRFGHGRGMHEYAFDEQLDRRGGRTYVEEKERFVERGPARANFDINDLQAASDTANRALAPYRRQSVSEQRDAEVVIRAPARPQFIRRQSSLDTFDRRPVYRQPHDGHRAPSNAAISLPIRRRSPSRRRVSPSRSRYREDDYEEIRFQDRNGDIEYRDIHIEKKKSRSRHKSRARSRARSVGISRRSSSSSSDRSANLEEISRYHGSKGKPGRTKMPKRLVHKMAVIELGYPFEEEEHFYIVRCALSKEEIDKVVQITETYKDSSGSYRVEHQETTTRHAHHPSQSSYREEYTREIVPPQSEVVYAHHGRAHSASGAGRHTIIEERIEGDHVGGPLTIVLPEHRHRSSRDIESEIRHLERERREIRYERDVDRYDLEVTEKSRDTDRSIIRLDRDRKGRKPNNPKLVAAMMATLT